MKRMLFLFLVLGLLVVAAKPSQTAISYYDTESYSNWLSDSLYMSALDYPIAQEGTFKRVGNSWVADMPYLVHLYGQCETKSAPVHVKAFLYADGVMIHTLFNYENNNGDTYIVIPFTLTFKAQEIQVIITNYSNPLSIRCNVTIEPK